MGQDRVNFKPSLITVGTQQQIALGKFEQQVYAPSIYVPVCSKCQANA